MRPRRDVRTLLILRSVADRYARGGRVGPVAVRVVGQPPEDEGRWYAGCGSDAEPPGVVGALAERLARRSSLRAYVATLAGQAAAWEAAIPDVARGVEEARVEWDAPEIVVVTRARAEGLEAAIRAAWPDARIVWLGAAKAEALAADAADAVLRRRDARG